MAVALFTNNAFSTLASGITNVATSLTVAATEGARYPNPSGGDYFYATLSDTSSNIEIIKVTARSTDTFTIVRGRDGTSGRAYLTGDRVELRITAAVLEEFMHELLDDTTPALGGFLDASGNYIQMQTGGDIASASPLVIDTDGDSFDVSGTTNFAALTVAADRHFFTQFDGVLTMTHGGSLVLPGAANITTAAGDVAEWISTAANTVRCVNYTKADGTAVVLGFNLVDDTTPQLGGNLDFVGYDLNNIGAEDFDTTDKGSLSTSTTVTVADDTKQKFTVTGAFTLTITFGASSGHYQEVELEVVNGAAYVITWPTINWYKSDGTTSTTIGDLTAQLQASGTNVAIVWTRDGGTTKYGVLA